MKFKEWLVKFWGLAIPVVKQAEETGLSKEQIIEWAGWAQNLTHDRFMQTGEYMTVEQVAAEWEKQHPDPGPTIILKTVFGEQHVALSTLNVAGMTGQQLADIVTMCIKQVMAEILKPSPTPSS